MIVVDTSVWIDYFADRPVPHVDRLDQLVDRDASVALTDVVLTEVLQGVRLDTQMLRVEERLLRHPVLRLSHLDDFRRSAELYRTARQAGYTIRKTLDCLIASVCIREDVPLLHADADFDRLAEVSSLRIA